MARSPQPERNFRTRRVGIMKKANTLCRMHSAKIAVFIERGREYFLYEISPGFMLRAATLVRNVGVENRFGPDHFDTVHQRQAIEPIQQPARPTSSSSSPSGMQPFAEMSPGPQSSPTLGGSSTASSSGHKSPITISSASGSLVSSSPGPTEHASPLSAPFDNSSQSAETFSTFDMLPDYIEETPDPLSLETLVQGDLKTGMLPPTAPRPRRSASFSADSTVDGSTADGASEVTVPAKDSALKKVRTPLKGSPGIQKVIKLKSKPASLKKTNGRCNEWVNLLE